MSAKTVPMASALELNGLLASGRVWWGATSSVASDAPSWCLAELAGRYVELVGGASAGVSTAAVAMVRDAQQRREPVAWVTEPGVTFFPPDVVRMGVDLEALAVVCADGMAAMLRSADHLLRSGAFGLTVVDQRGARLRGEGAVPLAAQVRLAGLAKQHDSALLLLTAGAGRAAVERGGSMASLRVRSVRVRLAAGRFAVSVQAQKDKRRGMAWESVRVLRGPLGLR